MQHDDEDEQVRITLDGGLIRVKWAPGITITASAAEKAMAQVNRICGSDRHPMLVDMAGTSVARAARTVFLVPCAANAIALLGKSPVDRVVANFVLGMTELPTPTKFFTSEVAAMTWLGQLPD